MYQRKVNRTSRISEILFLATRWNLEKLASNNAEFDFTKFNRLLVSYAKENTALLTTFLSTPFTQIIGVDEDTSVIDAISSVGGLLGLFMGFTMVTVAEIVYYSFSLLITSIFGIKNQVKREKELILSPTFLSFSMQVGTDLPKRDRRQLGSIGIRKGQPSPSGKF